MTERTRNSTSNMLIFRLTDATTGAAKNGIDVTTLKLQFCVPGSAPSTATSLTLLASLTSNFSAYGAREIDATNSRGLYRVDTPDAAFAGSANSVEITVSGTGIEPSTRTIDIADVNTRNGGTKLPVTLAAGDLASGAIDFPQLTNELKGLLLRGYLTTTGTTTPVSNDTWFVGGYYNSVPFYQSFSLGLFAWNNGTGWTISTAVGVAGTSYWTTGSNPTVVGPYAAGGSAVGVPTIVAHGNAILATFQPDTPVPTAVQIRNELDANSTKLAAVATASNVTAAANAILSAMGSPLQASSYVTPPSAASIAAATAGVLFVDGAANSLKVNPDHTVNASSSGGGLIANYITIPAPVAIASQNPSVITCIRGDTLRISLPVMGDLTSRTKLTLTVKADINDADSQAVLQIIEGTGLTRLNGAIPMDSGSASLTVVNVTTGVVNLVMGANVTAQLAVCDLVWDAQAILSTGITSPIRGTLTVIADVTQSVT
jgi:hypothetical protein